MRHLKVIRLVTGVLFALLFTAFTSTPALAHQSKDMGDYHVAVGFAVEPAFQNQMNGVELFVSTKDGKQVEGLEKTIQFEVTAGGKSMPVAVHSVYKDPGHYVGEFMPTLAGDYVFHMTGKINDLAVDESFESGPGRFSAVSPIADVQFPNKNPSPDEQNTLILSAISTANQAQTFGIIGIVVGVIGIIVGGAGWLRRKA
jgi:hypothetical protein